MRVGMFDIIAENKVKELLQHSYDFKYPVVVTFRDDIANGSSRTGRVRCIYEELFDFKVCGDPIEMHPYHLVSTVVKSVEG